MASMKAIGVKGGKGPADAMFMDTISRPVPTGSQALVKIKAFGLNRMDLLQREGRYPVPPAAPTTMGVEFSGIIEELAEAQSDFKVGDEVFGLAYGGAYAEYISVSTRMLIHKPSHMSWEEAAGVPETWITATQALNLIGEFQSGKSVLWHAGASSVSIAGIQLSKALGAKEVFVTAGSQDKIDFCVNELGATAGFNYHTQDWAKGILEATGGKGVDLIVDFVGANYFGQNLVAAARDGRIVLLGLMSGAELPAGVNIGPILLKRLRIEGSTLRSRDEGYQEKLRNLLVENALPKFKDGKFNIFITKVLPYDQIIEAHKLLESNQTKGKIILTEEAEHSRKKLKTKSGERAEDTPHSHEKKKKKDKTSSASLSEPKNAAASVSEETVQEYLKSNTIEITDPLNKEKPPQPIISFDQLPDPENILYQPLKNFPAPTSVQAATWPLLFDGRDVIGIAETGSGKTLAFGLPCLKKMVDSKKKTKPSHPRAVILSPTRELAMQIYEQLEGYAPKVGVKVTCIYGGVRKDEQREALKDTAIVVATPGRLKDLQAEGAVNLSKVKFLVLDEADRMLDKGFEQDIKDIIGPMPVSRRQTAMFTATWPVSVRNLANSFTHDPAMVTVGGKPSEDPRANTRIKQVVEVLDPRDKENRLVQILGKLQKQSAQDKILVFCLYKKEAMRIERLIQSRGYAVAGIHGDLSQSDRFKSLASFKSGAVTILVATDVAARGLDIPAVKTVVNVTFPLTIEDYVHRIGRTGRAGADGHAITLFTETDKAHSGALINVLKAAKQDVPDSLFKFGTTVKKKQHDAYGAFFKSVDETKTATKITFDD
ncbi:hypothetical protein UA08_09119 [Talaromyces atroroseus]|uniref:RNA helicase n=1 Tax=Talaromyces atroroseus TaxID=1441469 RepID=A0A1Q5Q7D5_TALAT|nr:hypothetical protein UA08_09119 [Talaromyces atroroseus]OKL55650.1 hypothetical protein UA08_09119 [Talaromyces atroroseus]